MAVGTNLSYHGQRGIVAKFMKLMAMKPGGMRGRIQKFCVKNGAPANNTAADNPNALYDILVDETNGRVYICTAYSADASATTWTRIV